MCKRFSRSAVQKLKKWVEGKGGYLFTEDWVLVELVQEAWPQMARAGAYFKERTVDAVPARGNTTHPLMRGVYVTKSRSIETPLKEGPDKAFKPKTEVVGGDPVKRIREAIKRPCGNWKIDDESPRVILGQATPLLVSEILKKEAGSNDTLALTFKARLGRVLHVVSHFGRQQNREDEFILTNMLLNFIMEAVREGKKIKRRQK